MFYLPTLTHLSPIRDGSVCVLSATLPQYAPISEMRATVLYLVHIDHSISHQGWEMTVLYLPTLPLSRSLRNGSDCVISAHITTYLPQKWERLCYICPHIPLSLSSEMGATVLYLPTLPRISLRNESDCVLSAHITT